MDFTIVQSSVIEDLVQPVWKLPLSLSFVLVEGQKLHLLYDVVRSLLNVRIRALLNQFVVTRKLRMGVIQLRKNALNALI